VHFVGVQEVVFVLGQHLHDLLIVAAKEVRHVIEVGFDLRSVCANGLKQGVFGVFLPNFGIHNVLFEFVEDCTELQV